MIVDAYFVISNRGNVRLIKRLRSYKGSTIKPNEIAIKLKFDIPDELFKVPQLSAFIKIPKETVMPVEINSKVVVDVEDAIKKVTGLQMKVDVVKESEETNQNVE